MSISRFSVPANKPESVIEHLARGTAHWKMGRSAYELAHAWIKANDVPGPVRTVLNSCSDYASSRLVEGFFERSVDLRTPGYPSQTDLMLILAGNDGLSVVAVEGKVDESFGPVVDEWLAKTEETESLGKRTRLDALCTTLGLVPEETRPLRYQLLHRTTSAIYEAERYLAPRALMLVHSFSPKHAGFLDFQSFAAALGIPIDKPQTISASKQLGSVSLRVGWVADRPLCK